MTSKPIALVTGTQLKDRLLEIIRNPLGLWDEACTEHLLRHSPISGKMEVMEPGVNFFIKALGELGAETIASCEGHPYGFYILFTATEKLARRIRGAGFFDVELENGKDRWSIRLCGNEQGHFHSNGAWTDEDRIDVLKLAAQNWAKLLLPHKLHLD